MITAIDLCSGCGGWAVASRGLPIRWLAVADWAADCLETWQLNHRRDHPDCALVECDLSTADGAEAVVEALHGERVDLIVGGIPCEQVSRARGNRPLAEGEMERLHGLIDQVFGLVRLLRPRWWAIEDVEAILPHLPPPMVCGLPWEYRKINAGDYGPQARERIFFGAYPEPAAPEPGPRTLGEILRPGPYRTLPELKKYQRSNSRWYGGDKLRVQDTDRPAATVISSQGGMGSRAERSAMVRVQDADQACPTVADFSSRHERAALVGAKARNLNPAEPSPTVTGSYCRDERTLPLEDWPRPCDRPQDGAAPSLTVTGKGSGNGIQTVAVGDGLVRVMEWQEAALLQGFPPDYVFAASWSRTWKLVAQAIPIQVGRAILQGIVAQHGGTP